MNNKTIVAVSVVKNENDVIESFCRYVTSYCDRLIIHDDNSSDNTKTIIESLIMEGLPITFLDEYETPEYHEYRIPSFEIINILAKVAFDSFHADLVIPCDADEFIMCQDGSSPRTVLEALDAGVENHVKWRTFICNNELMYNDQFLPDYFTSYRNPALEHFSKTMMSRRLYETYHSRFTNGYHTMSHNEHLERPQIHISPELYIAHYPIRSGGQMITKIVNGWLSYLASPTRVSGQGFHWEEIYHTIKETQKLDKELLKDVSMKYALKDSDFTSEDLTSEHGSIKPIFLTKAIKLKYTDYSLNQEYCWSRVLENTEKMILFLVKNQLELQECNHKVKQKADALAVQKEKLCDLYSKTQNELEMMRNSHSWKLAKPLRKVANIFRRLRKSIFDS